MRRPVEQVLEATLNDLTGEDPQDPSRHLYEYLNRSIRRSSLLYLIHKRGSEKLSKIICKLKDAWYRFLFGRSEQSTASTRLAYRKGRTQHTWHFCLNCSAWPTAQYEESMIGPNGEICNECRARLRSGDCRSAAA